MCSNNISGEDCVGKQNNWEGKSVTKSKKRIIVLGRSFKKTARKPSQEGNKHQKTKSCCKDLNWEWSLQKIQGTQTFPAHHAVEVGYNNSVSNKALQYTRKPKNSITQIFSKQVVEFFEDDRVSRMCAGKKEFVKKGAVKQCRVLMDTLQNLH